MERVFQEDRRFYELFKFIERTSYEHMFVYLRRWISRF